MSLSESLSESISNLVQGTKEWLEWRHAGIGASESAALMGCDKYGKTPYKLWLEKTKPIKESQDAPIENRAMGVGHEVEAKIRASYEFDKGIEFQPCLMEFAGWPVLRASLDGWNSESKSGVEIKYVGAEAYEAGTIPEHHQVQLQHQMLVAGVSEWTYLISNDGVHYKAIPAVEDLDMQKEILERSARFWKCVEEKVQPPYTEDDWIPSNDLELVKAITDGDREKIFSLVKHKKTECAGKRINAETKRITQVKP